jgi:hypothetical protein
MLMFPYFINKILRREFKDHVKPLLKKWCIQEVNPCPMIQNCVLESTLALQRNLREL